MVLKFQLQRRVPSKGVPGLTAHPDCRSHWSIMRIVSREGMIPFMSVAAGYLDPACVAYDTKVHERRHRAGELQQDRVDYGLSVYGTVGKDRTQVRRDGRQVALPPSTFLVVNPSEVLWLDPDGGFLGFHLSLGQPFLRLYREMVGIPRSAGPFNFEFSVRKLGGSLKAVVGQLIQWTERPQAAEGRWLPMALYGAGMQIVGMLWAQHPSGLRDLLNRGGYGDGLDPRLHQALEHLRAHLDRPVQAVAAARAGGLSRAALFRLCHAQTGRSPEQWHLEWKFDHAERLMALSPGAPHLEDIASQVGFSSASALKRALKARGRLSAR